MTDIMYGLTGFICGTIIGVAVTLAICFPQGATP